MGECFCELESGREPSGERFFIERSWVDVEVAFHSSAGEVHFACLGVSEEFLISVGADSQHQIVLVGESAGHVAVDEEAETSEHLFLAETRDTSEKGSESVGEELVHGWRGVGDEGDSGLMLGVWFWMLGTDRWGELKIRGPCWLAGLNLQRYALGIEAVHDPHDLSEVF